MINSEKLSLFRKGNSLTQGLTDVPLKNVSIQGVQLGIEVMKLTLGGMYAPKKTTWDECLAWYRKAISENILLDIWCQYEGPFCDLQIYIACAAHKLTGIVE